MSVDYRDKYIKYKNKYFELKNLKGGDYNINLFNKLNIYNPSDYNAESLNSWAFIPLINYVINNDFLFFKQNYLANKPNMELIYFFGNNTEWLADIIRETIKNFLEKIEEFQIKITTYEKTELKILLDNLHNASDKFLLSFKDVDRDAFEYLQKDKEKKIYEIDINPNRKQIRFMNTDVYNILSFSLKNTEGELNTNIGKIYWTYIRYISNKYYYLINLYKKYKIKQVLDDPKTSEFCNSVKERKQCIDLNFICQWNERAEFNKQCEIITKKWNI
jgi:hypothetical protein